MPDHDNDMWQKDILPLRHPSPIVERLEHGSLFGIPLDRRFTGPHAIMKSCFGIFYTVHDIDGGGSSVEAGAWYPDAFNDFSSGLGEW